MRATDDEGRWIPGLREAMSSYMFQEIVKEKDPLEKSKDFNKKVHLKKVDKFQKDGYLSLVHIKVDGKYKTIYTNKPCNYWHGKVGKDILLKGRIIKEQEEEYFLVEDTEIVVEADDVVGKPVYTQEDLLNNTTKMNRLSYNQQRYLKAIIQNARNYSDNSYKGENTFSKNKISRVLFHSTEDMKAAYGVLEKIIPDEICLKIDSLFRELGQGSFLSGTSETRNTKKVLFYLINYDWFGLNNPIYDINFIKEKLNCCLVGLEHAKKQLLQEVAISMKSHNSPKPILLVGDEGSGCERLAQELFRAMNISNSSFPMASIADANLLTGSGRLYDNGQPSMLFTRLFEVGSNGGMLLENIDEVNEKCHSALLSFLERKYSDVFLETYIPIDDLWIIATANDTSKIPLSILKKMRVIHMDRYSKTEKEKIITDIFVPEFCQMFKMHNATISKEIRNKIINELVSGNDIKSIKSIVRTMFAAALERDEKEFHVTIKNFDSYYFPGDVKKVKGEYARELSAMEHKNQICAGLYPTEVRERNTKLIALARGDDPEDRAYALKALPITVNILKEDSCDMNVGQIREALDESHCGMEKAKKSIIKALVSDVLAKDKKVKAILLDGCAGIGKTTIARAIAKATGRKFVKVSLNGISEADALRGYNRTVKDSHAGIIVNGLAKEGVCSYNTVMLLDEVDKMIVGTHSDPYTALYDLLDSDGGYWNNYLETYIPTENILFILTSNNMNKVPQTILDRVQVIKLQGYSFTEKYKIAKDYIIPRLVTSYSLNGLMISDEDLEYLLMNYCNSYGVRDVERALESIVVDLATSHNMVLPKEMHIKREDMVRALGAKQIPMDDFPSGSENTYGQSRALAVAGNYGSSFAIQVIDLPFAKKDMVTGLAKGSFAESIELAKTVVSKILNQPLPYLHIHVTESGVEKDGPSAGVALFLAIMSFMRKTPLPNIASTGTIDLFGNIGVVGGIKLKLAAAERAGVKKVYMSKVNYEQLVEDNELSKFALEICPVTNVYQVMEEIFSNAEESKR